MKYLFLDIDGVLVHYFTASEPIDGSLLYLPKRQEFEGEHFHPLDPACVERVNQIVYATGCEVVLSSTWRNNAPMGVLDRYFRSEGATFEVQQKTPGGGGYRGTQIKEFLDTLGHSDATIAVLDDSSDTKPYMDRLVHVYHGWNEGGVLDEHVDQAIALLAPPETQVEKIRAVNITDAEAFVTMLVDVGVSTRILADILDTGPSTVKRWIEGVTKASVPMRHWYRMKLLEHLEREQ